MDTNDHEQRRVNRPFDSGRWLADLAQAPRDAECLNVNRDTANLDLLPRFAAVRTLAAREVPVAIMESALATMGALEELDIFGTRMTSLAPLAGLPLVRLRLVWAHQIADLAPLATLERLEVLTIGDMKRAHDFSPLGRCKALKALHLESGMWAKQKLDSLAFLRELPQLEELSMHDLGIGDDDLTPICALKGLKFLHLPTRYHVREYARLAVCLPDTACEQFGTHASFRVASGLDPDSEDGFRWQEHVVLVGRPSSGFARTDPRCTPAIARRAALLETWRTHYRKVPDPAADRSETPA